MPTKVVTIDGTLQVYQARDLTSRVICQLSRGVEIQLGDVSSCDGREWVEAALDGEVTGYVLAPSARGHTTFGAEETKTPYSFVDHVPISDPTDQDQMVVDPELTELRETQAEVRKALRGLLITTLVVPVLFTLFFLFVLDLPFSDDEAALFLADGLLLPLAIGAVIWRRTGAGQRSLRRDMANGVLRPIPANRFPHVQELVRNTRLKCGLYDVNLNLLYSRSASLLPSVTRDLAGVYLVIPAGFVALSASDEPVAMAMLAHECAHIVHNDTEFWQAVQAHSTVMLIVFLPLLALSVLFDGVSALLGVLSGAPVVAISGLGLRLTQIRSLIRLRRQLGRGRRLSEELADRFACHNSDRTGLITAIRSLTSPRTRSGVIGQVHPEKTERLKSLSAALEEPGQPASLNIAVTPLRVRLSDRLRTEVREIAQRHRRALTVAAVVSAVVMSAALILGRRCGVVAVDVGSQTQLILYSKASSSADVARLYGKPVLIRMPAGSRSESSDIFIAVVRGRPGDRVHALDYRLYVNDRVVVDRSSQKPHDYVPPKPPPPQRTHNFFDDDDDVDTNQPEMTQEHTTTFWDRFPPDWLGWSGSKEQDSMLNLPRKGNAIVLPPDGYFVDGSFTRGIISRQEMLGDPLWVLWAYYPHGWSSVIFRVYPRVMFAPPQPSDP